MIIKFDNVIILKEFPFDSSLLIQSNDSSFIISLDLEKVVWLSRQSYEPIGIWNRSILID